MKIVFPLALTLLACGCDPTAGMNGDSQNQSQAVSIKSAELSQFLKVNVVGATPEKYVVQFSWPHITDNKIIRIRLVNVLTEVTPDQTFFTHEVAHNQVLTYSFDILDTSKTLERSIQKTVQIPYDFVVRDSQNQIPAKLDANRIYLSESIPLLTLGQDVDVTVNEIHANKGTINSYPEDFPSAEIGTQGKTAGRISITAKTLFGKLKISMRGQKGGQGAKGDPWPRASTGTPAGNGTRDCNQIPNSENPSLLMVGPCYCDSNGSNGGPGSPGVVGNTGKPGLQGGDSGKLRVIINNFIPHEGSEVTSPDDEKAPVVDVSEIPGAGGDPGPGGDGQIGGLGGPTPGGQCDGRPGPAGVNGQTGQPGLLGLPGNLGSKCIFIGSENVDQCNE